MTILSPEERASYNRKEIEAGAVYHNNAIAIQKKFLLKEISEKNELLEMFSLRYQVYRYVNFIEPNKRQLDIDCYDLYSTFLGAFELTDTSKRLIGTLRIISEDEKSPSTKLIQSIFKTMADKKYKDLLHKPAPFPLLQTFAISHTNLAPLINLSGITTGTSKLPVNQKPYEISRLAILPEYWNSRAKIEESLHDLIILNSWKSQPHKNIFIIATHPRTRRKYQSLAFKTIPGTTECLYKDINQLAIAMIMNLEEFLRQSDTYAERCRSVFPFFQKNGYFIRER